MNDLVMVYQQYLENSIRRSESYTEPISLKRFTDCGLSENNLVVYLRFVDLLRSSAMIGLTTYLGRGNENKAMHESCESYGQRLMDDYIAFISDITGLSIKPKFNAYRYMSFGIGSITYSYGFNAGLDWFSFDTKNTQTRGSAINKMFLSFDDFRADLELLTAHLVLGHEFTFETEDDEIERIRGLSTEEISIRKAKAESFISEHESERWSPPDLHEHSSYSDIISSARSIKKWYETLDDLDDYENQLELYEKEIDRRKELKKATATPSPYSGNIRKPLAHSQTTISWEKQERRPYCKCRYPSCSDNSFREGYCWYHYQEEYYLSK